MKANMARGEEQTRIAIRLPTALHRLLVKSAAQFERSINYEIVTRLRASMDLDRLIDADTADEALQLLDKMKRRYRDLRLP
jgi:hypothetical protein